MIGLNKIGLNQVQLNRLRLNAPFPTCRKMAGGGGSSDGFPQLPGDVTRWYFGGLTNEMMAAMDDPRIEDADHKGRFLSFNNFAWGEMSGCGGYDYNFTKKSIFNYSGANVNAKIASDTFYIEKVDNARINISIKLAQFKCRLKITGVSDSINSGEIQLLRMYSSKDFDNRITIKTDGIYDVDIPNQEDGLIFIFAVSPQGTIENPLTLTTPITIEQLPLYSDALVFDGVDDYGICDNFPILTKEKGYTVVALRQWIEEKNDSTALVSNCKNWGQDGAFLFEYNNLRINFLNVAISFGHVSSVDRGKSPFSYQTSKLYNGKNIEPGSFIGSNELVVGKGNKDFPTVSKVAIWELIILDHDATEEELTKIKNYFVKTYPWLFFDQAWTVVGKSNEDTDMATIANITGNGNNLVLSNFGFAGNSGYGEYAYNWNEWGIDNGAATNVSKQYNKFVAVMPANQSISACSLYSSEVSIGTKFQFKLKITGLTTNWVVRVMEGYTGDSNIIYKFDKDGTYQIDHTMTGSGNQLRLYIRMYCAVPNTEGTTVTVEQIPDHEGYLVTDGVDDWIASPNFTLGKKFTVVGEWELLDKGTVSAGFIKPVDFYLYPHTNGLSFHCKRRSNATLFNNIKSLVAFNSEGVAYDHSWQKYVDTKVGDANPNHSSMTIGTGNNAFVKVAFKNMAMYAEKVLSKEDMIKAYIYLQTLKAK